jgi:hypothetical protein
VSYLLGWSAYKEIHPVFLTLHSVSSHYNLKHEPTRWTLEKITKLIPMLNNLIYAASSLAVDCGSGGSTSTFDHLEYQPDNANIGAASYYVTRIGAQTWGLSNVGNFMGAPNNYIIYNTSQFNNTQDSKLFQTARMSPSSLRFYFLSQGFEF